MLALTLALFVPAVSAQMYRWVDQDGVTVYSEQPPADTAATPIRTQPGPSAEDTLSAQERIRTLVEQDFDKREEAARQAEESRKGAENQAARQANCQAARTNLETIQNLGGKLLRTPDGAYRQVPDAERVKLADEARKQIQENCN